MNFRESLTSIESLFHIRGIKQRDDMCATCPSRPGHSGTRLLWNKRRPQHKCLEDIETVCAGEYSPTAYFNRRKMLVDPSREG